MIILIDKGESPENKSTFHRVKKIKKMFSPSSSPSFTAELCPHTRPIVHMSAQKRWGPYPAVYDNSYH